MSSILNRKVLLLNQSYEPLMVIGAKRAIILLFNKKVDYIESYKERVTSAYLSIPLPSVIILKEYARIQRRGIVVSRKNILKRDNQTCQYCGIQSVQMTIDHIVAKNNGGLDTWENLVAACVPCNTFKGNKSLTDAKMKLKKSPRRPTMIMHFQKYVKQFQDSWRPYLFMKEKN
tara:strand:+ start:2207 stop:2728 length:522 start_codon:yes stop_codon:yes gene_type:complete